MNSGSPVVFGAIATALMCYEKKTSCVGCVRLILGDTLRANQRAATQLLVFTGSSPDDSQTIEAAAFKLGGRRQSYACV